VLLILVKINFLAASMLLVSLVPNTQFRQAYRSARGMCTLQKEVLLASDAKETLHEIYNFLLNLLKKAKEFTDPPLHGSNKLTAYFVLLNYFLISRTEKIMVNIIILFKIIYLLYYIVKCFKF